jgi:lipoate-protein ligase A
MLCINLESNDPFFNLAIEELLLKNSKEDYLILYINSPSVIIGKHQSGHREVNTKFVTENHIPVIRRISGGGTVYHDFGNLNFCFIKECETGRQVDFRKYTLPVIDFLKSMGVNAVFEGKNDLKVEGLKISGNAEHIFGNRVLHHGTLLFSTSLNILRNSIRKDTSCYSSRAVGSNPASVTNLNDRLACFGEIEEFRSEMMNYFIKEFPDACPYEITETNIFEAELIAATKYKTWEWNWAYGPEYKFNNRFNIDGHEHSFSLFIKDGIIHECTLEGSTQIKNLSERLIGCRHMVRDISEVLKNENVLITDEEIFNFF